MKRKILILIIIIVLSMILTGAVNVSSSQTNFETIDESYFIKQEQWEKNNQDSLPIWLTPEELEKIDEIGIGFVPTSNPPAPIRQPAEFETMQGVLIRYPFGITYELIREMAKDVEVVTVVNDNSEKNYVISQYQTNGVNLDNCDFLIAPSNSYWTRDYGPWFIFNGDDEQGIADHIYNRPRPDDDQIPVELGNYYGIPVYGMDLVHAGGNYMTDGQGISVSTDLVWSENSGKTHQEINDILEDYCGIHTYHVIPDALGDYIKHIDCWAKFLAPDIIMIIKTSQSHSNYDEIEDAVEYFENQTSCYGTPYKIERVYSHMSEPYINCLILNDKVLVPISGSQWDDEAIDSYEDALPGYQVLGFTGSWQSTDALHCRTIGIVDRHMLYIKHIPLSGNQYDEEGFYNITAKIFPYSGEDLVTSSTGIYWKVEGGSWNFEEFESLGNNNYFSLIPQQGNGTAFYYYVQAEDESGRIENHPYIGETMAYTFTSIIDNDPPEIIDLYGPTEGKVGEDYTYCVTATDPDDNLVYVQWDWDDGPETEWFGPYNSGDEICNNHSWDSQRTYRIKVKVKDEHGAVVEDTIEIKIPRLKLFSFQQIFERFIQRSPFFECLLSIFQMYN